MLKFLIIVAIVAYLFYKIGSFFFRVGAASQQMRNFHEQQRRNFNGQPNPSQSQSTKSKSNGKQGEYIDYEEVK